MPKKQKASQKYSVDLVSRFSTSSAMIGGALYRSSIFTDVCWILSRRLCSISLLSTDSSVVACVIRALSSAWIGGMVERSSSMSMVMERFLGLADFVLDFGFVFVEETPAVRTTGAGGAFIVYLCGSLAALRCFALCEGGRLCHCSASTHGVGC